MRLIWRFIWLGLAFAVAQISVAGPFSSLSQNSEKNAEETQNEKLRNESLGIALSKSYSLESSLTSATSKEAQSPVSGKNISSDTSNIPPTSTIVPSSQGTSNTTFPSGIVLGIVAASVGSTLIVLIAKSRNKPVLQK